MDATQAPKVVAVSAPAPEPQGGDGNGTTWALKVATMTPSPGPQGEVGNDNTQTPRRGRQRQQWHQPPGPEGDDNDNNATRAPKAKMTPPANHQPRALKATNDDATPGDTTALCLAHENLVFAVSSHSSTCPHLPALSALACALLCPRALSGRVPVLRRFPALLAHCSPACPRPSLLSPGP